MKRLRVLCPSVQDPSRPNSYFTTAPCEGRTCSFWKKGGCSAGAEIRDSYERHLDKEVLPDCPKADAAVCRWHADAVERGEPACPVRRLGMVCEHAGGEWVTWDMVGPDDWDRKMP